MTIGCDSTAAVTAAMASGSSTTQTVCTTPSPAPGSAGGPARSGTAAVGALGVTDKTIKFGVSYTESQGEANAAFAGFRHEIQAELCQIGAKLAEDDSALAKNERSLASMT